MTSAVIPSSVGRHPSRIVARRWASLTDVRRRNNKCASMIWRHPVVRKHNAVVLNGQLRANCIQLVPNFLAGFRIRIIQKPDCRTPQPGALLPTN